MLMLSVVAPPAHGAAADPVIIKLHCYPAGNLFCTCDHGHCSRQSYRDADALLKTTGGGCIHLKMAIMQGYFNRSELFHHE